MPGVATTLASSSRPTSVVCHFCSLGSEASRTWLPIWQQLSEEIVPCRHPAIRRNFL